MELKEKFSWLKAGFFIFAWYFVLTAVVKLLGAILDAPDSSDTWGFWITLVIFTVYGISYLFRVTYIAGGKKDE